jgi:hypothetical protein
MAVADLPITILNDPELIDLGGHLKSAIGRHAPQHPWFGLLGADIQTQIAAVNLSSGRPTGNSFTEALAAADAARDQAYIQFRSGLEYFRQNDDPAKRTAAENLLAHVRTRDYSLQRLGDREQSVQLRALLGDLSAAAAQADLALIGLAGEVAKLRQKQADFDALVVQRELQDVQHKEIPSLPVVRDLLRQDLALTQASIAFVERLDASTFGALAAEASEHITSAVATARARRTRQASKAESPPAPPTPNAA